MMIMTFSLSPNGEFLPEFLSGSILFNQVVEIPDILYCAPAIHSSLVYMSLYK